MIDKDRFLTITDVVIERLEGGYYHPNMLKDGRVKDMRYRNSGETMFGIDRKAGAGLAKYPEFGVFWNKMDSLNAANNWSWNYGGGVNAGELKRLAGDIIYQEYLDLSRRYLSPEAQKIVNSDPRLTFNFAYATWNGSGWFQRFAKTINEAVAKGETNPDKLVDLAVQQRMNSSNSLIAQQGRKINGFIQNIEFVEFVTKYRNPLYLGIGLIVIGAAMYYLSKNN